MYSSSNIIRVIKSRRMRLAGHVVRMGRRELHAGILVAKPEGNRPLRRSLRRWEDNIKMDLREIVCRVMDWIDLAQDTDKWRALVNMVMNIQVPPPKKNIGKFLSS
jgi:hypothetical protein